MSVEEELEMLKEYRCWPEGELEQVNEQIRRPRGERPARRAEQEQAGGSH